MNDRASGPDGRLTPHRAFPMFQRVVFPERGRMSQAVLDALEARFPEAVQQTWSERGDEVARIRREAIVEVCRWLKDDPAMDMKLLCDLTAVDWLDKKPRFEVVYNMRSLTKWHRVRLKVALEEEDLTVPSVTGVWRTADWWERLAYDMFGVRFLGHPDLRRILLYPEFVGHPLRKDYPVQGRQPLVVERDTRDLVRGPGPAEGGDQVPYSMTRGRRFDE